VFPNDGWKSVNGTAGSGLPLAFRWSLLAGIRGHRRDAHDTFGSATCGTLSETAGTSAKAQNPARRPAGTGTGTGTDNFS
jgi:hypothetical protein